LDQDITIVNFVLWSKKFECQPRRTLRHGSIVDTSCISIDDPTKLPVSKADFKLWTYVATGMGLGGSKPQSYLRYDNDFELVIRATKDLERLLETKFGAPNAKDAGLHDKITAAAERHGISQSTVRLMRKLVTSTLLGGLVILRDLTLCISMPTSSKSDCP
jgi:hypothetical protein